MSGYDLSRLWFSFAYENPDVKPVHTALYFWIVERANASGWKKVVDIQTEKSMDSLGITDWRTYKNALQFLADNRIITWIEKSKNQYTCNKISLLIGDIETGDSYKNAYAFNAEPNAEAIAEAIAEAYAEAHVKAIAEALQSYINLKTSKPKKPKNPKTSSLHQSAIAAFVEDYLSRFGTSYIFQSGKDGTAIKGLIDKITKKTIEAEVDPTDENILQGFTLFLTSITDDWVLRNFTPAVINSKFNELFKSAKNGTVASKTDHSDYLRFKHAREQAGSSIYS